ncbi:sugar phosphate isomerase/epimerase family protein [Zavarzinella formosa]|uniref:sugar phosphate isomerase/epimerase family protein n=1 Tax=Zavarzinella formosa TaxID=360055 RepID=UPI000907C685|nr:sugar phosphate isomerase/epimerase family protein [Zavarzinella formosa]
MNVCISQATTLPAGVIDDLTAFADIESAGAELWLTKIEKHLEQHSFDELKNLFVSRNLRPAAASYQGGLLLSQGEQRKAAFDLFRKRLELCQALGVPTMVLVADFAQKVDSQSLQRSIVSLKQAGQWAAGFGVRLALEFRGGDTFCSCLETALMVVGQTGEPNVGVCLDWFHFYKGSSKPDDLAGLTNANLFHVQVADVAGIPRELMTDSDRVMPGDGDFSFTPLADNLKRIGYDGWVSLETFNPVFWQLKHTQVAELGLMAVNRIFE